MIDDVQLAYSLNSFRDTDRMIMLLAAHINRGVAVAGGLGRDSVMGQATADFELGVGVGGRSRPVIRAQRQRGTRSTTNGNSITYDSAHAYGSLAAKYDSTVSRGVATTSLIWNTGIGTLTDWYGRVYVYATANPTRHLLPGL